ncbi:type VI secretion system-associated protein TagF [Pseudoduganella plicata]|nr:type VI secretion system-associated protein TagF [Pseudoduganella plicata]
MTHGDFVARRLPAGPQAMWDAWLQTALQGSRQGLGRAWMETYLTSPVWRFALAGGVVDGGAWAGVLMPSVDRVGRHFPLTVLGPIADGPALAEWLASGQGWYERVEALALSSLDEGFSLEAFDAALLALAPALDGLSAAAGAHGAAGYWLQLGSLDELAAALPQLLGAALHGHSLWWTDGSEAVQPCALLCRGLPAPAAFAEMLGGAPVSPGSVPAPP